MTLKLSILSLYSFVLIVFILKPANCERRIVNGTLSTSEPKFLAYFVKSAQSERDYTGWVCGGCIVHPVYILTSAACLEDVKHVYAIAGYTKYVSAENIDKDKCTSRVKKKVIARSFQKDYDLKEFESFNWNSRDIGLAKVETPYDFRDPVFKTYCSYPPAIIRINFKTNFENPGTQAVTFGWGHKKYFRAVDDFYDYNTERVNYASTVVIDKELCKKELVGHTDIKDHVNLYLICTLGPGTLDETGKMNNSTFFFNSSEPCETNKSKTDNGLKPNGNILLTNFRRFSENEDLDIYSTDPFLSMHSVQKDFRRHGPCQNDHGGPLVTWIGGRQYVIGVACGFQVNKRMECVGPYLYTSTHSNGEFLYCMLRYSRGSNMCVTLPKEKGFRIVEEDVAWAKDNDIGKIIFNE